MVVDDSKLVPYLEWLLLDSSSALVVFLITAVILGVFGLLLSLFVSSLRYGPLRAFEVVGASVKRACLDFTHISPRRVYGLTRLAMREAWRRRVWITVVIFLLILMFAGWGLNPGTLQPAKLYLNFVLTATAALMLLLVLFLSVFSLPADLSNRTIHTVVTKPVRPIEIILGRILGFSAVATVLLLIMGVASYLFVTRTLAHSHAIDHDELTENRSTTGTERRVLNYEGVTSKGLKHRHRVSIAVGAFEPGIVLGESEPPSETPVVIQVHAEASDAGIEVGDAIESIGDVRIVGMPPQQAERRLYGEAGTTVSVGVKGNDGQSRKVELTRHVAFFETENSHGHFHRAQATWSPEGVEYELGPAEGMLVARVPHYGTISFLDVDGAPTKRGVSVGKLWNYHSWIRGGSSAAAIWQFKDVTEDRFADGLPLEMDVRVYRSYKGDVTEGIRGGIVLVNPDTGLRSRVETFTAREFRLFPYTIPRQLEDSKQNPIDLFKDLVTEDGRLQIELKCLEPSQYFGAARGSLYLREPNASFAGNLFKGYISIWLQMILVTSIGVMFSTFLSGPVALVQTGSMILMGLFTDDIIQLTHSVLYRKEFVAIDLLKRFGFKLDEQGLAAAESLREKGYSEFQGMTPDRWQAAMDMGLDDVSALDRVYGGGPLESLIRIVTQENLVNDLEQSIPLTICQYIDYGLMFSVRQLSYLLPDFRRFDDAHYVAEGFSIPTTLILQQSTATMAFAAAAIVAAYFFLQSREVAK